MTIRELERRSGLERTNIRFYEKESLLNPERKENGYRDYSEADLQLLMKIKLLRRLDFSIEAIRSLINGNTDLEQALERRLQAIGAQRRELNATEQVCQEMKADRVVFSTLDAQRYLDNYDRALHTPSSTTSIRPTVPQSDRIQPVRCPWRRYFGRMLDLTFGTLILWSILSLVFRVNVGELGGFAEWLLTFVEWGIWLPIEALLLSRWGTTPGKWIMGIRVEHEDGRRLTFGEAIDRTWLVFVKGMGANIPIYSIYRLWKSYKAARDGNCDDLEWEWKVYSVQIVKERECPGWRPAVLAVAYAVVIFAASVIAIFPGYYPPCRGSELTVDEFVKNYNTMARFHGYDGDELQTDGTFENVIYPDSTVVHVGGESEDLVLRLEETDGILTKVSFERDITRFYSGPDPDAEGQRAVLLSAMSYAWADCSMSEARRSQEILEQFTGWHEGHVEENFLNCRLTYTVERGEDTLHEGGAFWEEHYTACFELVPLD